MCFEANYSFSDIRNKMVLVGFIENWVKKTHAVCLMQHI